MKIIKKSLFPLLLFMVLLCAGCEKRVSLVQYNQILSNDSIVVENKFGVVRPRFLRIKEQPNYDAKGLFTLQQNDVVKVRLKVSQVGGWCEIDSPELRGWVPIDELVLFDNVKEAANYQSNTDRLTETRNY